MNKPSRMVASIFIFVFTITVGQERSWPIELLNDSTSKDDNRVLSERSKKNSIDTSEVGLTKGIYKMYLENWNKSDSLLVRLLSREKDDSLNYPIDSGFQRFRDKEQYDIEITAPKEQSFFEIFSFLLGAQFLFGLTTGILFSRSSVKVFFIGIIFQTGLLYCSLQMQNFVDPNVEFNYINSLITLGYYGPGFALVTMVVVGSFRAIKWGLAKAIICFSKSR